jgi:hypothetical protein
MAEMATKKMTATSPLSVRWSDEEREEFAAVTWFSAFVGNDSPVDDDSMSHLVRYILNRFVENYFDTHGGRQAVMSAYLDAHAAKLAAMAADYRGRREAMDTPPSRRSSS